MPNQSEKIVFDKKPEFQGKATQRGDIYQLLRSYSTTKRLKTAVGKDGMMDVTGSGAKDGNFLCRFRKKTGTPIAKAIAWHCAIRLQFVAQILTEKIALGKGIFAQGDFLF